MGVGCTPFQVSVGGTSASADSQRRCSSLAITTMFLEFGYLSLILFLGGNSLTCTIVPIPLCNPEYFFLYNKFLTLTCGLKLLKNKMCGLNKCEQGFDADNCDHLAHTAWEISNSIALISLPHKCVD